MPNIHSNFSVLPVLCALWTGCAAAPQKVGATADKAALAPRSGEAALAPPSVLVTEAFGSPHIGQLAPDFELVDQGGAHVRLSELRGSVVVLAFVASFCPFSAAAQPNLARL